MLALYQPLNALWCLPVTLAGALVFAVSCARRKTPGQTTPVQIVSWAMAAGGIVGMIAVTTWNKSRLRSELRAVRPAEVSHVTLARGAVVRPVADPATATRILTLLTDAKSVAAHHSHPVEPVTVTFEFRGDLYTYRVGRDSAVPDEFWVVSLNPGCTRFGELELGRLQTSEWTPLVESLLKENR